MRIKSRASFLTIENRFQYFCLAYEYGETRFRSKQTNRSQSSINEPNYKRSSSLFYLISFIILEYQNKKQKKYANKQNPEHVLTYLDHNYYDLADLITSLLSIFLQFYDWSRLRIWYKPEIASFYSAFFEFSI